MSLDFLWYSGTTKIIKKRYKMRYALDINILLVVFYNFVALKNTIIGISFLTAAFIDSLITSNAPGYVLKVFLLVTIWESYF